MTQSRDIEQRISSWLEEEAVSHLPDRVLDATFEQTRELIQQNLSEAGKHSQFTRVVLVKEQQSPRMSLADDLYRQAYGEPHPHRHEWVIVQEAPVEDNNIDWERVQ